MNKKERRFLTITQICKGISGMNYGQGSGNTSEVKYMIVDGEKCPTLSQQSIKSEFPRIGVELFGEDSGYNLNKSVEKITNGEKTKASTSKNANIKDSINCDLAGYMKPTKGKTGGSSNRTCVRSVTPAIALHSYETTMDFMTNKRWADAVGSDSSPVSIEHYNGYYVWTYNLELDRLGIDGDIILPNEERTSRALMDLDILKHLTKKVKGATNDLSPLFTIGGVYSNSVPYFMNRVGVKNGMDLEIDDIKKVLDKKISIFSDSKVREFTYIGLDKNIFSNQDAVNRELNPTSIDDFFSNIAKDVKEYYKKEDC